MSGQNSRPPDLIAWSLFLMLALIWGSSFILMKKGLTAFQPGEIAGIRIFSASLFLLPIAVSGLKTLKKRHLPFLFISGFFGSLLPAFLFPLAQTRIDSAVTGVLNSLTPLFTLILGMLFFHARSTTRILSGILIGLVGSVILMSASQSSSIAGVNYFALFIVTATIFYGLNVNIIKFYLSDMRPVHIASVSMVMIGPFALIYLLTSGHVLGTLQAHRSAILPLLYVMILGIVGTALAMIVFNNMIKRTNTVFASSVTYIIPVVAVIWGIIDGEKLLFHDYAGMAAIILGVLIANKGRK